MENIFIVIAITYYRHRAPEIHYYRNDYKSEPLSSWDNMTVNEANQLMWELVKLGGENSYRSNIYDNGISERRVTFWGHM